MHPDGDAGSGSREDFLPLSGLQHLVFCERQCALIHVERAWDENHLTLEGRHVHERVDRPGEEHRTGVRVLRAVVLCSTALRVAGVADVVEMYAAGGGVEVPYPVEYKRGRRMKREADDVQVCAQAICLEEAFDVEVPRGALFYWSSRQRREIEFDAALRARTRAAALRLHELVSARQVPRAEPGRKCRDCSLLETCMPWTTNVDASRRYLAGLVAP